MRKRLICLLCVLLTALLPVSAAFGDRTVTMTFTGDITLGGENARQGRNDSFTAFAKRYGLDYFLSQVRGLFSEDDITIVNLEGTLTDSSGSENTKKAYRFRAPRSYVQVLTGSSVELCNIANNHIMDFGSQGFNSTHSTLDEAGIGYFGRQELFLWEKDGIRIAFFGINSTDFYPLRTWAREKVAELKEAGVNAVVFCFHAGTEYSKVRNKAQSNMAAWAINVGADLVIMHHPHVVQGMDIIDNRSIFYLLGNFCFGGNSTVRSLQSLIVRATFTFSDEGKYLGQQIDLYPANISGTEPQSNFQPRLVRGSEAQAVFKLVQFDTAFPLPSYDDELGCMRMPFLPAAPLLDLAD